MEKIDVSEAARKYWFANPMREVWRGGMVGEISIGVARFPLNGKVKRIKLGRTDEQLPHGGKSKPR